MARFDIYRNKRGKNLLLDVQADILSEIKTRVVVPLAPAGDKILSATRLNPVFNIEGKSYLMVTPSLAAVPASALGKKQTSLNDHHDEIVAALDMLFQGF